MKKLSKIQLLSILLVVMVPMFAFLNYQLNSNSTSKFRNPASYLISSLRSASETVERRLASVLAFKKKRGSASIAKPADPFDSLRFGVLEGKYALTMNGDKLTEIDFVDTQESQGSPKMISNRLEFLKSTAKLMGFSGMPEKIDVEIHGAKVTEVYKARLAKNDEEVFVRVTIDDLDRLIKIKVQN